MVTKDGVSKKTAASDFTDVRRSGIIAIKLSPGDELMQGAFVDKGDSIILVTEKGQSIRFKETDIREMGRAAAGVRAMKLGKGDKLIAADVVRKEHEGAELLVLSETGYGKKTPMDEYKIQNRSGSGIKTTSVTTKTKALIAARIITSEVEELVVISKKGVVIRVDLSGIPSLSRATQGVRIMKLREGDSIASLICL